MSLPFHLIRALWADPAARRRYLRVGFIQSLVIIALTVGIYRSGSQGSEGAEERARRGEHTDSQKAASPEKEERERFKLEVKLAAEELAYEIRSASGVEEKPAPEGPLPPGEVSEAQGGTPGLLGLIDKQLQLLLALFGLMQIVQWVVIALSRDYHDAISRDASLLTALEPEDEQLTPRVRVDLQWMRKKLSRRIRGFVVFLAGLPLLYALTAALPIRNELLAVLIPAWSAYWVVVFTTAKSAHAWKNSDAGEPWFLRGWNRLTTQVPGFRWRFLQRYGLFWANRTRSVYPPAAATEKQPWVFAGLALTRVLSMLPLVKCFLRPVIPVAAAHLLVAHSAAQPSAPSKPLDPPAPPPAASSATAA
ncbi:hypothetical protein [Hyalangium sp.]|uniref:hypothetical protein n=1 Tax=Hyalangium sp. TaxID=2028555 RepID=UPI002D671F75|nr:hypothetical protein [Hyalangium sp.]HYI00128.1 hypothetical protein [Hyalangium sp.]